MCLSVVILFMVSVYFIVSMIGSWNRLPALIVIPYEKHRWEVVITVFVSCRSRMLLNFDVLRIDGGNASPWSNEKYLWYCFLLEFHLIIKKHTPLLSFQNIALPWKCESPSTSGFRTPPMFTRKKHKGTGRLFIQWFIQGHWQNLK